MIIDHTIILVSAIIRKKSKILLLKRSKTNKHYRHYWQLPEGKLETNESPVDAMIRELKEELNYTPKKLELSYILPIPIKAQGTAFLLIKAVFKTQGIASITVCSDHVTYNWYFPSEALKKLRLVPGTRETLQKL